MCLRFTVIFLSLISYKERCMSFINPDEVAILASDFDSLDFLDGNPLGQDRKQPIYDKVEGWTQDYPEIVAIADSQMHAFWPHDEPEVANDIADLRVNCIHAEQHGITTTLQLFTQYEIHAGEDYWMERFCKNFKRPEFQRMGSMNAAVELNSHAPFYDAINKALYLDNPEFYGAWRKSPVLSERMRFVGKVINHEDDLVSLGGFSFVEGAVLYSSFAFIKHFQTQDCGKDLIKNINRGVNLSVGDENLHAIGGALVYRKLREERKLTPEQELKLARLMTQVALKVFEHEREIIDMIYSEGDIPGLTKTSLLDFVKHRINICLQNLSVPPLFDDSKLDGFVESWFYRNINSYQFSDFFTGSGSEYTINWKRERFGRIWRKPEQLASTTDITDVEVKQTGEVTSVNLDLIIKIGEAH